MNSFKQNNLIINYKQLKDVIMGEEEKEREVFVYLCETILTIRKQPSAKLRFVVNCLSIFKFRKKTLNLEVNGP